MHTYPTSNDARILGRDYGASPHETFFETTIRSKVDSQNQIFMYCRISREQSFPRLVPRTIFFFEQLTVRLESFAALTWLNFD